MPRVAPAPALNLDLAFWHLTGLFVQPVLTGGVAAGLAKLVWRRRLAAMPWWRLAVAASVAMATVAVAGLVLFGQDGRMATYGAMVVAGAVALWWFGLRRSVA